LCSVGKPAEICEYFVIAFGGHWQTLERVCGVRFDRGVLMRRAGHTGNSSGRSDLMDYVLIGKCRKEREKENEKG
ncbi:MAG: hypothetical protein K2K55_10965, partial [Duncaniella sp.]|nr:hypothetical protein [Duncaniella sp.]